MLLQCSVPVLVLERGSIIVQSTSTSRQVTGKRRYGTYAYINIFVYRRV